MLAIRYRGTIIRTTACKLLILGVFSICMFMFMRLQGLFLADIPLANDNKQSFTGSVFPRHPKHFISSAIFTPVPRSSQNTDSELQAFLRTSSDNIKTWIYKVPTVQNPTQISTIKLDEIRKFVQKLNSEQKIKNLDKFPDHLTDKSVVIIIQVHNRPDYFAHLLRSLSRARGIENALLVISHDFYDEYINSLVDAINFCRVSAIS